MMNLDTTFAALADPTRRAILARLAKGDAIVTELAEPFAISLPAISRHLHVLEAASLIVRERDGKRFRCRLRPQHLAQAHAWLSDYARFWTDAFDRLDAHLQQSIEKESS